jgi:hypothetical protein
MKNRIMVLVAIGFALLIAGSAWAATTAISTPTLAVGGDVDEITCTVLNTGTKELVNIVVEIINLDGNLVTDGTSPLVISAEHTGQISFGGTMPSFARCKVSGVTIKSARVALMLKDTGGNVVAVVTGQ